EAAMRYAATLAAGGEGLVEPNPAVGAVVVDDQLRLLGEGWHRRFGASHAEVDALASAGEAAAGATLVVTLEPCCHQGQTPACTDVVIGSGVNRVIVGIEDPSPHAAGAGIEILKQAGLTVEVGRAADEVRRLNAAFLQLVTIGRPWIHAKWAMTLDGRIAAAGGHSQWISNDESRQLVHRLRGRVDAILVGIGTALADDPLLTARPDGPRVATRVVLDSHARLPSESRLVQSADRVPLLVVCSDAAEAIRVEALKEAGVEVLQCAGDASGRIDLAGLLHECGTRRWTHVLAEGGSEVLGSLADGNWIDEVHVFLAPKLVGGRQAVAAVGGDGLSRIPETAAFECRECCSVGDDVYWRGVRRGAAESRDC
ncbi:MAG: bifunctional diaminohydroxyphosphoribosylaminopyrimidine deaminase/5-amino-6-(5-phosphoribosylamino)uracil reductase RibD, partial [Planctomycetaceae bacterium]